MPASRPRSRRRELDGNHILYRYLQGELLSRDIWLFQMLTARLVAGLGVWLAPEIYQRYPLLRPYAVRDPDSRGNRRQGIPDQWGSPNRDGLFRDDNSLIKQMPYSLLIHGPQNQLYDGARVRQGYVASHVWRQLSGENGLAARNRLTYSFVPNLVWLPREVSKLTDREGSFVQGYIQAIAMKIYRKIPLSSALQPIVDQAWALLPPPSHMPPEGVPAVEDLNFFLPTPAIYARWETDLRKVIDALRETRRGGSVRGKVIASRYAPGLSSVSKRALGELERQLSSYEAAVTASIAPL